MNRSAATWLVVLLSAWTLPGAAERNTDADADMTEEEIAEELADIGIFIGPSAFCTSYTDNGKRRIYLTGRLRRGFGRLAQREGRSPFYGEER